MAFLAFYAVPGEEERGGMRYFCGPPASMTTTKLEDQLTATEVMALWQNKGKVPRCQWHVHALQWVPKKKEDGEEEVVVDGANI